MMASDSKRATKYSAPKLVIYGDMAKFTASASGSIIEMAGEPNGQLMQHRT